MSSSDNDFSKFFNMLPFAFVNPQVAMISFLNMANEMMKHPEKVENARKDLVNRCIDLAEYATKKIVNEDASHIQIKSNDKRFNDPEWDENVALNIIKQFYLSLSEWMVNSINDVDGIDRKLHQQANFYLKQYLDALHPSNFPMLNPVVVRKTVEENGDNFKKGFNLLLNDLKKGAITTHDSECFSVGKNLADTDGKVIYKNYLIELIQYTPATDKVYKVPLLFIPPWINKFYILDLGYKMSLVRWLVEHGFNVFMISWVNPDGRYKNIGFEDYATDGVIAALEQINKITNEKLVNAVGYCVGGTLVSTILAALGHKSCHLHPAAKIASATLLTTPLDFERASDLSVFMDDNYLKLVGAQMDQSGFMDGRIMYNTFSVLKANDMVWRYMVDSYMLGNKPAQHSTLFWNADSTNLTRRMQRFLSKTLYRDNKLKEGKIHLFGVPVEIPNIKQPVYMISMLKDHLIPWQATFDGSKLFDTMLKFVVGGSGHVAGVINPPEQKKYSYWTNDNTNYSSPKEWMDDAIEHAGSWWIDWIEWLKQRSEDMIPAKKINDFLYDAPGGYVMNQLPSKIK